MSADRTSSGKDAEAAKCAHGVSLATSCMTCIRYGDEDPRGLDHGRTPSAAKDDSESCVTVRRTLQQIRHCVEEAESVIANGEADSDAIADLDQARQLLGNVMMRIRRKEHRDVE